MCILFSFFFSITNIRRNDRIRDRTCTRHRSSSQDQNRWPKRSFRSLTASRLSPFHRFFRGLCSRHRWFTVARRTIRRGVVSNEGSVSLEAERFRESWLKANPCRPIDRFYCFHNSLLLPFPPYFVQTQNISRKRDREFLRDGKVVSQGWEEFWKICCSVSVSEK